MSFFTALGLMFEPLRRLSNIAGQVQASLASVERIYDASTARRRSCGPGDAETHGAGRHPV
jgi:ABC-type multidrug transport system fused ATPase/permease subunit